MEILKGMLNKFIIWKQNLNNIGNPIKINLTLFYITKYFFVKLLIIIKKIFSILENNK